LRALEPTAKEGRDGKRTNVLRKTRNEIQSERKLMKRTLCDESFYWERVGLESGEGKESFVMYKKEGAKQRIAKEDSSCGANAFQGLQLRSKDKAQVTWKRAASGN